MAGQTKPAYKEAKEMLSKTRTTIITLVASAGFVVAAVAPAASQAQWHNYCVAGHCTEHKNFTLGGVEPCQAIKANYEKASGSLSDAKTAKEKEEAEGQVHLSEIASFEWGCDIAARKSSTPLEATKATLSPLRAL
jgi:hypothetical protein